MGELPTYNFSVRLTGYRVEEWPLGIRGAPPQYNVFVDLDFLAKDVHGKNISLFVMLFDKNGKRNSYEVVFLGDFNGGTVEKKASTRLVAYKPGEYKLYWAECDYKPMCPLHEIGTVFVPPFQTVLIKAGTVYLSSAQSHIGVEVNVTLLPIYHYNYPKKFNPHIRATITLFGQTKTLEGYGTVSTTFVAPKEYVGKKVKGTVELEVEYDPSLIAPS